MSIKGVKKFKVDLSKKIESIKDDYKSYLINVSLQLYNDLYSENPLDTGASRASWNFSINEINDNIVTKVQALAEPGIDFARLTENINEISKINISGDSLQLYFVNYIDYIEELEVTHPTQRGWIATSVERSRTS